LSSDKSSVSSPRADPKSKGLAAAKKSRWSAEGNRASNTLSFSPPPYNGPQRQRATNYLCIVTNYRVISFSNLTRRRCCPIQAADIAGMVAAMTEYELGALG